MHIHWHNQFKLFNEAYSQPATGGLKYGVCFFRQSTNLAKVCRYTLKGLLANFLSLNRSLLHLAQHSRFGISLSLLCSFTQKSTVEAPFDTSLLVCALKKVLFG